MQPAPFLHVHLLGGFRVLLDGQPVSECAWRQRRGAAVVKLLALAPGLRLHREQVIELLWPDLDPSAQANNFNVSVTRARRAVAESGARVAGLLSRAGPMLVLAPPGRAWVDVAAFEQAATEASRVGEPAAFQRALALYAGDLLPEDLYESWTEHRRHSLQAACLALLNRLGQIHIERGEHEEALGVYQRLLDIDPAHEHAHVALMRLHAHAGRRSQALAQYGQLARALRRELDSEPDSATTALAEAIRHGTIAITLPPPGTFDARVGLPALLLDTLAARVATARATHPSVTH